MLSSLSPLSYCLLPLPGELVLSFFVVVFSQGGGRRERRGIKILSQRKDTVVLRGRTREGRGILSVRWSDKTLTSTGVSPGKSQGEHQKEPLGPEAEQERWNLRGPG